MKLINKQRLLELKWELFLGLLLVVILISGPIFVGLVTYLVNPIYTQMGCYIGLSLSALFIIAMHYDYE